MLSWLNTSWSDERTDQEMYAGGWTDDTYRPIQGGNGNSNALRLGVDGGGLIGGLGVRPDTYVQGRRKRLTFSWQMHVVHGWDNQRTCSWDVRVMAVPNMEFVKLC